MVEKIYNVVVYSVMVIYSIISLVLLIILPKYNLLFNGWWCFLLILPALGNLLFQSNKFSSLCILVTGILLFIASIGIISFTKCFTILLYLAIIIIGISVVRMTIGIPEKYDSTKKYIPFYYTFFGATEEIVGNTLVNGGNVNTVCGSTIVDLRNASLEDDAKLKNISVLGTTEFIVPDDIEVITNSSNILGGIENIRKVDNKKRKKKIYIESLCILGNVKIK